MLISFCNEIDLQCNHLTKSEVKKELNERFNDFYKEWKKNNK